MSSQRGNVSRTRKQKYQNSSAFKNDKHDTSHTIKLINSINHEGLCQSCKEKIEWKVKYKKYKPLTQPAKCVTCHNKGVKRAYHIVCQPCAEKAGICAKCNKKKEIALPVQPSAQEAMAEEEMNRFELMHLPERKRRTVLRYIEKGDGASASAIVDAHDGDLGDEDDEDFDDVDEESDPKDLSEIATRDDS